MPPVPPELRAAGAACHCVTESAQPRTHACASPPFHAKTLSLPQTKPKLPLLATENPFLAWPSGFHPGTPILGGDQGRSAGSALVPVCVQGHACPQDAERRCGSSQEAADSCRCRWLLPLGGDIFGSRGAPGGCPLPWLMKGALWSLAGPSWEIKGGFVPR